MGRLRLNKRDKGIVTDFCLGMAPSEIDAKLKLVEGTAHDIIIGWWLDDKMYRNGGMEKILLDAVPMRRNW